MEITIVIPIYNRAGCLLRTLRTIPSCYPLILVDNGSTDGSLQIAEDFCRQRSGSICVVESAHGASAARNCGLAHCHTEWIYFFDSDDLFTALPDVNPTVAAASDMICFPVSMNAEGRERIRDYRPVADAATHILSAMLSTQSMLFRTEWLRHIGGWDTRCPIWNDWELGLRALLHHPRLHWQEGEAFHHILVHHDSITGPSYTARWRSIDVTLAVAYDDVRRLGDARTLRALDLRLYIVSGILRREGSPEAGATLLSQVPPSHLGRLLAWYTACGGRGAWRIALASLGRI